MKTVKNIKEEINIEKLVKEFDENPIVYDNLDLQDIFMSKVASEISSLIVKNSKNASSRSISGGHVEYHWNMEINNENVIEFLNDLSATTDNGFIKNVIETVSTRKFYTEKQIRVICEEAAKFDSLTLNF